MPFIALARTDISDGVLQVTDLWPNVSQRNATIDPQGQGPLYVSAPQNAPVALNAIGSQRLVRSEVSGLQAYLLDRVEDGAGAALTPAQAQSLADALIAQMQGGGVLDATTVDSVLNAAVAGVALAGGTSTGVLSELLQVIAGASYTLPAGTEVQTAGGAFVTTQDGTLGGFRAVLDTDGSTISFNQGVLSQLASANYVFDGTTGAAVVVYNDDGTLYV